MKGSEHMPKKPREDGRAPRTVASDKYTQNNYDRLSPVYVKKGMKEVVSSYAKEHYGSVNLMMNRLLEKEIEGFEAIEMKPASNKPKKD